MTNIVLWALAGGVAGWIGHSFMKLNEERGLMTSIVIGLVGGLLGGKLVAPMIGAGGAVTPGDFSPFHLFIAFACAVGILVVTSMLHKRFGF